MEGSEKIMPGQSTPNPTGNGIHRIRRPLTEEDLVRMNFGRRFWEVSLSNVPEDLDHRAEIAKYLSKLDHMIEKGFGLLLWGPNDTGKTALACIIGKEARRRNYKVFFIEASEITDSTIRNLPFDDEESVEGRCKSVDLLILDDLGKEAYSGKSTYMEREIQEIIRARYNNMRPTIITSNLERDETEEIYGDSFVSLFKDSIYPIKVEGIDFRDIKGELLKESMNGG